LRSQDERAAFPEVVLTEFYTEACGFCREEAMILEELAEVFARKVEFRRIDAQVEGRLAEEQVVFNVPTLILERDGELVERFNGFVAGERLERAIRDALR
jgi:thioredoxin 1